MNHVVPSDKLPEMRRSGLLVIALLAACNGGSDGEGAGSTTTEAPTTTAAETTTTTSAPDPFTVPDDPADIDEAYVEAVLAELERINGDALRLAVTEGLSPAVSELVLSIFGADQAEDELDSLVASAGTGFEGFARPPGDVAVEVDEVLLVTSACVAVNVTEDYSAVGSSGIVDAPSRVELAPSNGSNPTPWVVSLHRPLDGTIAPPEPCTSSS